MQCIAIVVTTNHASGDLVIVKFWQAANSAVRRGVSVCTFSPAELEIAASLMACRFFSPPHPHVMSTSNVKVTSLGLFILDTFEYSDEHGNPVSLSPAQLDPLSELNVLHLS